MKKYLKIIFLSFLLTSVLLVSCGSDENESSEITSGDTLVLNVFNWGEYISDGFEGSMDVNAEFERYYLENFGVEVKVNYSTYATNEDMYSKLSGGAGSYDIIIPSDYMIDKMIEEDMLIPFGADTIENYQYILDDYKNLY